MMLGDFGRVKSGYALRRVPQEHFARLMPIIGKPSVGDIVLAQVEKVGKNARLELPSGRLSTLFPGDVIAVVFGNRYATLQFEGYARMAGNSCDLLSAGGLCGIVESRHQAMPEPTKLKVLGAIGDVQYAPLNLRNYKALFQSSPIGPIPNIIAVCGSSMDAGKTHTAKSIVMGLRQAGESAGAIKLTGTAAGRDTWSYHDAGATPALDFVDAGWPSTFQCTLPELMEIFEVLVAKAHWEGADWVVMEIADGLYQKETAALLGSAEFRNAVSHWVFATEGPLAAFAGLTELSKYGIRPTAMSGVISQSPLAIKEAELATGITCHTATALQSGVLNELFMGTSLELYEGRQCI